MSSLRINGLLVGLIVCSCLVATDTRFVATSYERHQRLREELTEGIEKPLCERSEIFGTLGGARTDWARRGWTVSAAYVLNGLGNPIGGRSRGIATTGSMGFNLNYLICQRGNGTAWEANAIFTYRHGSNLSTEKIDNALCVSNIFGEETYRLSLLYLGYTSCRGDFRFKVGRLAASADFATSPLYYYYVNDAFNGNPISLQDNLVFFSPHVGTWGMYGQLEFRRLRLQAGLYNANDTVNRNRDHGVNFTFRSTNGLQLAGQATYLTTWRGLPGHIGAGILYQTGFAPRFVGPNSRGNGAVYLMADQMVRRTGEGEAQGFIPWVIAAWAPSDRNLFPLNVQAGCLFKGICARRPDDALALGVAYAAFSSDLGQAQRAARAAGIKGKYGDQPQFEEAVVELTYWFQVTPAFSFQPDLQVVFNPNGFGTLPDAAVIGFQLSLDF